MSYVQKTLSEKREYLVLQVGECRAQVAALEVRGAAIQAEIGELQGAIVDIDSVLASLRGPLITSQRLDSAEVVYHNGI